VILLHSNRYQHIYVACVFIIMRSFLDDSEGGNGFVVFRINILSFIQLQLLFWQRIYSRWPMEGIVCVLHVISFSRLTIT